MNLRPLTHNHACRIIDQMVDSSLAETRVFWRLRHGGATLDQARDPRPFAEVMSKERSA